MTVEVKKLFQRLLQNSPSAGDEGLTWRVVVEAMKRIPEVTGQVGTGRADAQEVRVRDRLVKDNLVVVPSLLRVCWERTDLEARVPSLFRFVS